MAKRKTHHEESDILVVGGGMAGTGATFEARPWGRDLKIICFSTSCFFFIRFNLVIFTIIKFKR